MIELLELEIRSLGVREVAEEWKRDHDQVRTVWLLEDVIHVFGSVTGAIEHRQRVNERQPLPSSELDRFLHVVRNLHHAGELLVQALVQEESNGYDVKNAAELRKCVADLKLLLEKNERAVPIRKALEAIQSSLEDRPMTDEEAKDFDRALAFPPSRIQVSPVARKNGS